MSPGANKRQTGTVPKAKATRKSSVPQEIVAPTRRDLQQHLNVSTNYFPDQFYAENFPYIIFLLVPKASEAFDCDRLTAKSFP